MLFKLPDPYLFINGQWIKSVSTFPVINPSTNQIIANCCSATLIETKQAIDACHRAFPSWQQTTPRQRSNLLLKWHDLIQMNDKQLATILTSESGKPYKEALGEIKYGASFIKWFSEEAVRNYGETIPYNNKRLFTMKQPIGPCGLITPWNFPTAMVTRKASAALASGCTVVIKPASETPLSALALVKLAEQAGFPPGTINVIPCSHEETSSIGKEFCLNPLLKKISFTGSTRVGKLLMKQSAENLKKLSLELGGNSPFIVFEDADLDLAVDQCFQAKFRNCGQTCISVNRVFLHDSIYQAFVSKMISKLDSVKVGDGFDNVDIGPLISSKTVEKFERHLKDALNKGASLLYGGRSLPSIGPNYYQPTMVGPCNSTMLVNDEETFGPLLAIYKFTNEQQCIDQANNVSTGLAGYFFTQNIDRLYRVAEQLQVGMVGVNDAMISNEIGPFGGIKESGFGREGSKYGMDEYTFIKYVCLKSRM